MQQFLLSFLVLASMHLPANNPTTDAEREADLRKWVAGYGESFGGIHYKRAGRTSAGFDCSGFTKYIFNVYGIELSGSASAQAAQGKPVSLKEAQRGDLIFFGYRGRITHVGIIVSNTEDGIVAVHSTSSRGIMTENVTKSKYWKPKILFVRDVITGNTSPVNYTNDEASK